MEVLIYGLKQELRECPFYVPSWDLGKVSKASALNGKVREDGVVELLKNSVVKINILIQYFKNQN